MSNKIYNFYFQMSTNEYRIYTPRYKNFETLNKEKLYKLSHRYEMMKGYEATDDGLLDYYNDFMVWNNELYKSGLDAYTFSYSNKHAVKRAFMKYTNSEIYNLKKNDNPIGEIESFYFENCHNGGLIYCKNGTYDCHGYDFISFYPRILGDEKYSDFLIPINAGKKTKLDHLDFNDIQFGFYNVHIECHNDEFLKIFKYSKKHIYTHYSLLFAIKHQKEFNIKIELLKDYDAYLYDQKDLVKAHELFGSWFKRILDVKNAFPKNKLAKHLLSSLWGVLSEFQTFNVKEEDLEKYDVGLKTDDNDYYITQDSNQVNNSYCTLMKKSNLYKIDLRLKPFLLSYTRNVMGDIAYKNHFSEIVRIYTDNIVYKSNVEFDVEYMIKEEKTSGLITWQNNRQI